MLTYRSFAFSAAVMVVALLPEKGFPQLSPKNGGWVTRNGNVFELSQARKDTIVVVNPVTEEEEVKIREIDPRPVKMNGVSIAVKADKEPYFTAPDKNLDAYLIKHLGKELSQLPNGKYWLKLNDVITDEKGRIVYFNYTGLENTHEKGANEIEKRLEDIINQKVQELVNKAPAYIPATLDGKNVPAYAGEYHQFFSVTDHKIKVD